MIGRLALALAVGFATLVALRLWRGYPWQLAAVVGLAAAFLVGMTLATGQRLVRLWRGERER